VSSAVAETHTPEQAAVRAAAERAAAAAPGVRAAGGPARIGARGPDRSDQRPPITVASTEAARKVTNGHA